MVRTIVWNPTSAILDPRLLVDTMIFSIEDDDMRRWFLLRIKKFWAR